MLILALACTGAPDISQPLVTPADSSPDAAPTEAWPGGTPQLLVMLRKNLLVDEQLAESMDIVDRAAAAGYTGVVVADFKLNLVHTGELSDTYDEHLGQLVERIEGHGMVTIPAVLPFGYSEGILRSDPNLAEGQPIVGLPLTVREDGGLTPSSGELVSGGDFSSGLDGWSWWDEEVSADDGAARIDAGSGNARLVQTLAVEPHRQLQLSLRVKTEGFSADWWNVMLYDVEAERSRNHTGWSIASDQDWTPYDVAVNTGDSDSLSLYLGAWGGHSGTAWIDDVSVRETAPVNLLRRPGAPLTVTREGIELVEGVDLNELVDPMLGIDGSYDDWHTPVEIAAIDGGALSPGDRVTLDYYAVAPIDGYQVGACLTEPDTHVWIEGNLAAVVERFPNTPALFSQHDEMRHMNTCAACAVQGRDAGELLASHMGDISGAVDAALPGARLMVWSDMFDPNHNAHDDYYLVEGDVSGSWEGLGEDVLIVNWLHSPESLAWFDERGHPQILAGFYDASDGAEAAASERTDAGGIELAGMMYTTWTDDYTQLESYATGAR